jgi:hypothetical protein
LVTLVDLAAGAAALAVAAREPVLAAVVALTDPAVLAGAAFFAAVTSTSS